MSLSAFLLFIPACFALNLAFGPNSVLTVNFAIQRSIRFALLAGMGRLLAFVPMLTLAGVGMGALLAASAYAFAVIKWFGVAYLIWLGIQIYRSGGSRLSGEGPITLKEGLRSEFMVAIGNPKAILIFTAFLPQFAIPEHYAESFTIVSVCFLLLEWVSIACYAILARTVGTKVVKSVKAWTIFNRCCGLVMIAFAVLLATLKRPAT
ncbi:LysE family translocator [Carnimonas bestiolae]|uniref:LysE family translocator n=1 Tax=Carnimonas bestiolae TaxID=3402172 RepID=UPI003EDBB11A